MSKTELNEINESLQAALNAETHRVIELEISNKAMAGRNVALKILNKSLIAKDRETFSKQNHIHCN